jgi:hypothetical protein
MCKFTLRVVVPTLLAYWWLPLDPFRPRRYAATRPKQKQNAGSARPNRVTAVRLSACMSDRALRSFLWLLGAGGELPEHKDLARSDVPDGREHDQGWVLMHCGASTDCQVALVLVLPCAKLTK